MMDDELFFRDLEYALKRRVPRKESITGVRLVWFAKTLQNRKAIVITTPFDGKFYEITYNGDKEEMYVDQYEKRLNMKLTRSELDQHHDETRVFRDAMDTVFDKAVKESANKTGTGSEISNETLRDMVAHIDRVRKMIAEKRIKIRAETKE